MDRLFLTLYAALMALAQPLLRRKLARRARQEPGYGEAVGERFGRYTQPREVASELVWIHAVSLGETRTAAILLTALRQAPPGLRVLLTHGTATGREQGRALLQPGDVQVWQPWDSRGAVARFYAHFKPRLGLLMETEVWPVTVAAARQRGMPLVLVNARLSDKSLAQALRVSPLALPAYGALTAVLAQTAGDAARFAQLGLQAQVTGNLKFDAQPSPSLQATGKAWRAALAQPVLLLASSREGEEGDFFKQISALALGNTACVAINSGVNLEPNEAAYYEAACHEAVQRPRVLVVPRHPQRFDEVAALAQAQGLRVSRRSQWPEAGPHASLDAMAADVWLGDSLSEMPLYYALADVALLGGSFAPLGGQNLIEAAACGCPVVMGPHTFNFADAAEQAEASGAAMRVDDMAEAVTAALALMADAPARATAIAAGLAVTESNRGATQATVMSLQPYL